MLILFRIGIMQIKNPRRDIDGIYQILVKTGKNIVPTVQIKNADLFLAYPLSEVLGKPLLSNKQCRNPRCDIHEYTRTFVRACV